MTRTRADKNELLPQAQATRPTSVLLIEDDPDHAQLIHIMLSQAGGTAFDLQAVDRLSTGLRNLSDGRLPSSEAADIVLLDLSLPDSTGLDTFTRLHAQAPQVPIIVLTGSDDEELAVQAVRGGAQDYLVKAQVDRDLLVRAIRYAIERKRAEQALEQRAAQLALINEIGGQIAAVLELDAVLDRAAHLMHEGFGYHNVWLFTVDRERGELVDRARAGVYAEIMPQGYRQKLSEGILGWVARHGERLLANDVSAEPRYVNPLPGSDEIITRAELSVPVRVAGETIAVLDIQSPHVDAFDESDVMVAETLAGQIAVAFENARLYQAARQVDRLRVLNELDRALAATLDQQQVAVTTLQQIAAALGAPEGMLIVMPEDGHGDDGLDRVFTLERGKVQGTPWEDMQRLHTLSRRLEDRDRHVPHERAPCAQHLAGMTPSNRPRSAASEEGPPLSLDDLVAISGRRDVAERWSANNLIFPIWSDGELLAVLALGGQASGPPLERDRALAQAAAHRAGQAIQNARLYRASQAHSTRLATLNAISAAAGSSLDLDTVLHQVLRLTCQALDAAEGSILMREPDTGNMFFALASAADDPARESLRGQYLQPGQGIAGWVAQHGQAVHVNDVHQDPRWYDGIDAATGFETHSLCCAPLQHAGEITGAIEIVNKRRGTFSSDDLGLLEAVASIAAVALENARLYTATRARADELALLNEIGLALTATLDYSTVVHAAVAQIQRLFQAETVVLLQLVPETGELDLVQAMADGADRRRSGADNQEQTVGEQRGHTLRLAPGEGITGWALEHRQPVLVEDAQQDARFLARVDQHIGTTTRAMMAAPLLTPEQAIGVIAVSSSAAGVYTREELRTLQALASTLAVALENASLYEELKTLLREWDEAQRQLIQTEKMAALGRLVASIAHEINNPLQAIQGCLTLVEEEVDGEQRPEALQRYLTTAGAEIERISDIVRRMRDFYRPARKGWQATDLHAVLDSVLALTNKQLQHSDVAVERDWTDALPTIQANPDHLKQVFLNLVLNAIDAMPAGGRLRVSTAHDHVQTEGAQPPQPAVRIEFSDTGQGISPGALSRIFEPFFTTKERGTGLGLSISYGIIQAHHGDITATSQRHRGTTFTILLPVEQTWRMQTPRMQTPE